ncbi:MAG: transposase [Deferrisomatales bacterium]
MPRIPRLLLRGESATYHVISRTALAGFVLGDVEKDYLVRLLRRLCGVYFTDPIGFCVMSNHLHVLVRMHTGEGVSDDEVRRRFRLYYGADTARELLDGDLPALREKWASLSEFVKDLKQSFSRWFNKTHGRKGFFWGERFKSVLVENGDTLINVLAYIDLNPVRAGIAERPEDYRWCSLGYHVQSGNQGGSSPSISVFGRSRPGATSSGCGPTGSTSTKSPRCPPPRGPRSPRRRWPPRSRRASSSPPPTACSSGPGTSPTAA